MKKKNRKKTIFFTIIVSFCIYLFVATFSYATFSERLSIGGVARTLELYMGETLPAEPQIQPNGHYAILTDTGTSDLLTFNTEFWNGDELTLNMKKSGLRWATRKNTFTINFHNYSVLPLINGSISTTLVDNPGNIIKGHSATINKTTVQPDDYFQVVVTIDATWFTATGTQRVKAVGKYYMEINGELQEKFFIININYGT